MWKLIGLFSVSFIYLITEITIKWLAFNMDTVMFDFGPKLCLWSTATLFTLSISEQLEIIEKDLQLLHSRSPDSMDGVKGIQRLQKMKPYYPTISYFFAFSLAFWVMSVVLAGRSLSLYLALGAWNWEAWFCFYTSLLLGALTVFMAILSVRGSVSDEWAGK